MIRITIEAPVRGGKTMAALAIKMALERLGARVTIRDEVLTASAVSHKQAAIEEREPVFRDVQVQIDTFMPPGVGG